MRLSALSTHFLTDDRVALMQAWSDVMAGWGYCKVPEREQEAQRLVLFSPSCQGWVTLVEDLSPARDPVRFRSLARALSHQLPCPVLSFASVESDVLYYFLWQRGRLQDRYCSWPAWHASGRARRAGNARWRGNPERLHALCRPGVSLSSLESLLRDYSLPSAEPPPWPRGLAERLGEHLGIEHPLLCYEAYARDRDGLHVLVPRHGLPPESVRVDLHRQRKAERWANWEHVRLARLETGDTVQQPEPQPPGASPPE